MSCAKVTTFCSGIACVSLPAGHCHSGRSITRTSRPLKMQDRRGSCSTTAYAQASSSDNAEETTPPPPPPPQSFSISRRSAIAGTGGMMIAGATAIADIPAAEAAAESFCGINGGVVPQWAYRTDFGQFFAEINGLNTYIRTVGSPQSRGPLNLFGASKKKVPVLVLHGGPGLSSSYMESLELLAAEGRQVVFYDQFGCGKSKMKGKGTRDPEASDYTLDSLVAQLSSVRKELGLEGAVHLLGHGWGGMLALEACTRADGCKGVVSLTVVSATPSSKLLVEDRLHAAGRLPKDVSEELLRQDSRGEGGAWTPAMQAYSAEFINRQSRNCYSTSRDDFSKDPMDALQGGHMFSVDGTMANWDVIDRLGGITVPTLVVRGENDEISMASMDELMKGIPTAKGLVCLDSGSCCHLDNPGTFLKEVNDHMDVSDGSGVPEA